MLKNKESAWRFARKMNLSYFREDRFGKDYRIRASVIE
jgi:hypothetical protein